MPDSLLDDLNPQQRRAVTASDGQVLVLAGPGSGKTRVLTRRLAYLVERRGVPAYDIIAVTFTNKAAREMENRVVNMVQQNLEGIWLGTFHAMCARLLRRESNYLPYKSNFVIFDSDDQESLVKRAMRELNIDDKTHRPGAVHAAISAAKNDLLMPEDMSIHTYRDEVVKRVYTRYQEMLTANNAVDFDDLLMLSARLLQEQPGVAERYARRFQHVLVDEFQDTNLAQYELLRQLSSYHKNIFVVGDEDQSIYRWRGADYRNVQRFETDFKGCEVVLLAQNYRSTQNVLDAARQVIDHNRNRTPKHLFTDRGAGGKLVQFTAVDDIAEAAYVVDTITQYLSSGRAKPHDFAVMYRTNAQSRLIEEAMIHARLPYRLVGALRFYGRREVKDMIAFLRLVENPSDEVSLLRVIGVPPRDVGPKTIKTLQNVAFHSNISMGEVLIDLGNRRNDSPYWEEFKRGVNNLIDFGAMLGHWVKDKNQSSITQLFDRIIDEIEYEKFINDQTEEGKGRWENIQELRRLANDYNEKGLTEFLQSLALVSDQDTLPAESDQPVQAQRGAVTLLTLHAAKGLEFNQVFILGLDEGLLPHSRSRDDPEEMAEERRLFYVGMTRAKNQLFLVRCDRRKILRMTGNGKSTYNFEDCEPSRFIADISNNLVNSQGIRGVSRNDSHFNDIRWKQQSMTNSSFSKRSISAFAIELQFKPGLRVIHPVFGEGMVIQSETDRQGNVTVTVNFEFVGVKHLDAKVARLKIIK